MISNSSNPQKIRFAGHWLLQIPEGWSFEQSSGSLAIFKDDEGVGAITLSAMRRATVVTANPAEIIEDFASGLRLGPINGCAPVSVPSACVGAAQGQFEKHGRYWLVRAVVAKRSVLIMSYNCALSDKNREQSELMEIFDSARCDSATSST